MSSAGDPLDDDRRASYTDTLLPSPPGSSASTVSLMSAPPSSTASSSRDSFSSTSSMSALTPNGKYYNPVVMSFIRDDWIQQQLHLRQAAYTAFQNTTIVAGTWNVNAKKPLSQSDEALKLQQWLFPQQQQHAPVFPDILALGFQEIVDLNAVNVVVNSAVSAQRSSSWEDAILSTLNSQSPAHQYKVVMEKHLVGILLLVFVRVEHVPFVKDVRGATAGVGIMGMMGNKGGAAIRLSYYDSTLCFVCAHLAAHRENVAGRNADYLNIMNKIDFRESDSDVCFSDTRCVRVICTCIARVISLTITLSQLLLQQTAEWRAADPEPRPRNLARGPELSHQRRALGRDRVSPRRERRVHRAPAARSAQH